VSDQQKSQAKGNVYADWTATLSLEAIARPPRWAISVNMGFLIRILLRSSCVGDHFSEICSCSVRSSGKCTVMASQTSFARTSWSTNGPNQGSSGTFVQSHHGLPFDICDTSPFPVDPTGTVPLVSDSLAHQDPQHCRILDYVPALCISVPPLTKVIDSSLRYLIVLPIFIARSLTLFSTSGNMVL
jgi:hypothetical protein